MNFSNIIEILNNKKGLEFGGPTELFSVPYHNMLLYPNVMLDGGNLFENNHFQSHIGNIYNFYPNKQGKQFNIDCADDSLINMLHGLEYDFIVTSHVIEHIANPIKAIKNWVKLLPKNGYILSIIPDYRYCFDRKRPLTTIEHLIEDYINNIGENDNTHIDEQKKLHDWSYGGHKDFYQLCDINEKTRVVHHHTFTPESFEQLINECGLKTIMSFKHDDLNIVNLSIKND